MICLKENKKRNSMLHDKQKKLAHFLTYLLIIALSTNIPTNAELTSLAKNDAIPMFSTLNIDEAFLLTKDQLLYKDIEWADKKHNRFGISISPFAQSADRGKTIKGQRTDITPATNTDFDTPLGDLTGRTGMIALLYGNSPEGQELPSILQDATDALFGEEGEGLNDAGNIDPGQEFGFFSFPLKYRKRGVRFEIDARIWRGFGLRIQTGVSTIRQVREATLNLTADPQPDGFTPVTTTLTKESVDEVLMDQLDTIAEQLHININDYIETSVEEVRFNFFWRQAFEVNRDAESYWARFLMIPYFEGAFSISPGKKDIHRKFFAVPFGNNAHNSIGFTTGINFDFVETIEIGGEVGYTHFFPRNFDNMPIPNSKFQTNLFPFSTDVSIKPGHNWHFGARIAAYHFIDNLSMFFEWFVLDHQQDSITLRAPNTVIVEPEEGVAVQEQVFVPNILAATTSFKTKLGNIGFNYDLAPNIAVGFLWQIPFSQRNSYRSSTLMAGFNVTF